MLALIEFAGFCFVAVCVLYVSLKIVKLILKDKEENKCSKPECQNEKGCEVCKK